MGSIPIGSTKRAPVAQWIRASGFGPESRRFESCSVYQGKYCGVLQGVGGIPTGIPRAVRRRPAYPIRTHSSVDQSKRFLPARSEVRVLLGVPNGLVAQSEEQVPPKDKVGGSNPPGIARTEERKRS